MAVSIIYKFALLLLYLNSVHPSKLNVPRVLLPLFSDFATNFTLEATEGGCYKWTTTRVDIIQLIQLDLDPDLECSTKVVVSTLSKEQARNMAVVLAEDVYTKHVLRCDVIVDVIDSLIITTTTRELFMEEAPEAFEVRANDNQGNEFTTLEGIEFAWTLVCMGPKKDLTVLRFMTFKDSPYETPATIEIIEKQNKRGHIVLLEGIKTGSAKVSVRLPHLQYKDLKPCEVQLAVIANLLIMPADVYIMLGDTVQFKIIRMNNGKMEEVPLKPKSQYYLAVESDIIASADKKTGIVSGLKVGKTRVILHDRNVDEKDPGLKLPAATVNVAAPAYMVLNILPHKNWAVLQLEYHDIVAEVYTSLDHKFHLGPGVEIHTQVGELFHIQERSKNGSWLTGWATEVGVAPVQALLQAVIHPKLGKFKIDPQISAQSEISIFPQITLNPADVILPWDPQLKPKFEVEVKASGGDGKFLWSSSNHTIGVVTQSGYVRTHFHGFFEVSAAMMRNHHNRRTARFHILPPTRLEIVEFVMEAEVGATIYLHVALFVEKVGKDGTSVSEIPFTRCQEIPLKVKPVENNFVQNKASIIAPVGISCANVALIGLSVGTTKVSVMYYSDGRFLEDSVSISAFNPLRLAHPKYCEIVLAVGTSVQLIFTGGPKPPIGKISDHKTTVTSSFNTTVEATDITESQVIPDEEDVTVVSVLCRKLGESDVTLSVTNVPVVPHCKNQEGIITVKVICGKPRSVSLQPEIKVADIDSCPMDLSAEKVVVQSYKDIELDVVVKDDCGRRFLNISSLKFDWVVTPKELGTFKIKDSVISRNLTKGTVIYANKSYQVITPKAKTGVINVKVTVIGYRKEALKAYKIIPEWPEFISEGEKAVDIAPITTAISLYLVDDTIVTPNVITIYNHPGTKRTVAVKQGSGFYELALNAADIARVKYLEGSREIEIVPQRDGELQVQVIDLCLASNPAIIVVNVVSAHVIRIEMSDKVEIGKCISCTVRLYDEADNLLTLPNLDMLDLQYNLDNEIVGVKKLTEDVKAPWPVGEVHYVITGLELGDSKLTFSITSGDCDVVSAPIELQVFPPLKVYPRNGTLIIGATLQYSSKGGPQPDSEIEYVTVVPKVADISSDGLVKGLKLGPTKIKARAVGTNPTTGQKVIYSEDAVDLQIIRLTGIKISAPLTRFQVGATVPVWASGIPEQLSPMIIATVEPPLKFDWIVNDTDIASISGIFQETGIEYLSEDLVSIRLTGLVPGKTTLNLCVMIPGCAIGCADKKEVRFTAKIDIEVFEGLTLINPPGSTGKAVLMAPYSSYQLKTNLDCVCQIKYSLPGEISVGPTDNNPLSVPNPIIIVSDTGVLQALSFPGRAMVLIIATDNQGLKQTLSIVIEVKPIHYMMLSVVANWRIQTDLPIEIVPVGVEFELKASYYDNTGSLFTAGTAELKSRSTRFDLIRIRQGSDNSSIRVTVRKPGQAVIKVWADAIQKTADYIKLHIAHTMAPVMDNLVIGDILCMWTPLVTCLYQAGRWTASEPSLIAIDGKTGVGKAVGIRGGQVAVGHTLHPGAPLNLLVLPIGRVIMLPEPDSILTNARSAGPYRLPLVLTNDKLKNKRTNLLNGWRCQGLLLSSINFYPFTCHLAFTNDSTRIDPLSVFEVESSFNAETGTYICELKPGPEENPNISTLNSNISVWAVIPSTGIEADPVEIPFVPAIYVAPELLLNEHTFRGILQITGRPSVLDAVTVTAYDENLLEVYKGYRPDPTILTHEIKLLDYHWKLDELIDPMSLSVVSKLTDEVIKVHVTLSDTSDKFGRPQCPGGQQSGLFNFLYKHRHSLAIGSSMVIIFMVTFYAYSNYIQPVVNVNISPNRSLLCSQVPQRASSICAALNYTQNLRNQSFNSSGSGCRCGSTSRSSGSGCCCGIVNREPVYGDPDSFYSSSPEVRRNRRFI